MSGPGPTTDLRIGPYSPFTAVGFAICNIGIPVFRGLGNESFWLTLLFVPVWGFCFTMAYRNEIKHFRGHRPWEFVLFNMIMALPFVLASYGIGRLLA